MGWWYTEYFLSIHLFGQRNMQPWGFCSWNDGQQGLTGQEYQMSNKYVIAFSLIYVDAI